MDKDQQHIFEKLDIVMEFRLSLADETDRGCALMAAEYISNELGELLRAYFVEDEKACDSMLESPNGALSTLSARIELAYLLGLIGPIACRELHLVRKIRNEFAHAYKPLMFSGTEIAGKCRELRAHCIRPGDSPRANFVRSVMGLLAVLHGRLRSVTYASVSKDALSGISAEAQQELGDQLREFVQELISDSGFDIAKGDQDPR